MAQKDLKGSLLGKCGTEKRAPAKLSIQQTTTIATQLVLIQLPPNIHQRQGVQRRMCVCVCVCVCARTYTSKHSAPTAWDDKAQKRQEWGALCKGSLVSLLQVSSGTHFVSHPYTTTSRSCSCGALFRHSGDLTHHKHFCHSSTTHNTMGVRVIYPESPHSRIPLSMSTIMDGQKCVLYLCTHQVTRCAFLSPLIDVYLNPFA